MYDLASPDKQRRGSVSETTIENQPINQHTDTSVAPSHNNHVFISPGRCTVLYVVPECLCVTECPIRHVDWLVEL